MRKQIWCFQSYKWAFKRNRNDSETVDRKNTHNITTEKKQSCHNPECKRNRNLRSYFAHSIFSQFKKKYFKLNNSMNEKLFKRTKIINNFRKINKRNKQCKRRNFAEILCFINIVSIFQRESTENIRTIRKKNNFHRICRRREYVDVQNKHERKLQNMKKIARSL